MDLARLTDVGAFLFRKSIHYRLPVIGGHQSLVLRNSGCARNEAARAH